MKTLEHAHLAGFLVAAGSYGKISGFRSVESTNVYEKESSAVADSERESVVVMDSVIVRLL